MAVREHLRDQVEKPPGQGELTKNEIELVRFVRDTAVDWDGHLQDRA
jgi:hypothetical protein